MSSIPLPAPTLLKSEIKALKKKKKKGLDAEDDELDPDEDAPKKRHADGELVDDLEEDDLAFGSGSDDDLSLMSEMDSEMSDMSDMSDLDSQDDGSEFDSEELEWESDEDGSEAEGEMVVKAKVAKAVPGSGESEEEDSEDDLSDDESDASDDSVASENAPRPKKRPAPEQDDLEMAYERRPAQPKAPKARLTKLPTIDNGQVQRAPSPLDRSPSPSPEPSPEPERRKEVEYRSDPLGQRFGRPAVRQLLEIKDKQERVSRAREEIADLGRDASGTGEGEGGVRPRLRSPTSWAALIIKKCR